MPSSRLSPTTFRKRSLPARLRREDGASLLEFAFSLGIFIAISFGLLILCWALFAYEYVDFASREAARWAAVRGADCINTSSMPGCPADGTVIENYVKNLNYPLIDPSQLTVTSNWYQANEINPSPGNPETWTWCGKGVVCNDPRNEVQVTVSYSFGYFIPFVGNFAPKMSNSATMVISQ